jgi:hypothetical protein
VRILAVLHIERLVKHLKASGILQNFWMNQTID